MKKTGRKIALFIILIAGLITLGSSMVSTYNDEYKLVLQFGKVVRVVDTPGLSFKVPFIQTTQSIPNYEMVYDLVPSEVNTRDKKVMLTDSFALWSVTDPLEYLSRLGASKANAESRISVVVYNAVKNVISSTDQADVISGRDGKLAELITERIGYHVRLVRGGDNIFHGIVDHHGNPLVRRVACSAPRTRPRYSRNRHAP